MQAVDVAQAEAREEVEPLCVTETVNEAGGLELPQCVPDTLEVGLRVPEALPQAVELLRGDRELLPLLLLHAPSLALPEEKALEEKLCVPLTHTLPLCVPLLHLVPAAESQPLTVCETDTLPQSEPVQEAVEEGQTDVVWVRVPHAVPLPVELLSLDRVA